MKRRIQEAFARAKEEKRAALIVYISAGDPTLQVTEELVPALAKAGADLIELGVPFSDPIADGPVIEAASVRSLAAGTTPAAILAMVARLRARGFDAPLALMTYVSPLESLGDLACVAESGVDGLIVPDLPHDEAGPLRIAARTHGLDLIGLVAPTTPPARLARIAADATGFLYYVSVTGVTGGRKELPADLPEALAAARAVSPVPVAVGFGIESAAQARSLASHADGVIVGSALVKALHEDGQPTRALAFVRDLAHALHRTDPEPEPRVPPC